jgi:hypothetical protein
LILLESIAILDELCCLLLVVGGAEARRSKKRLTPTASNFHDSKERAPFSAQRKTLWRMA